MFHLCSYDLERQDNEQRLEPLQNIWLFLFWSGLYPDYNCNGLGRKP